MDRGILDCETSELKDCVCGHKINSYSLAYGSTPYSIHCHGCGKDMHDGAYLVTEAVANLIDYWNNHLADMTVDKVKKECDKFRKLHKRKMEEGYSVYRWYWYKGKGRYVVQEA